MSATHEVGGVVFGWEEPHWWVPLGPHADPGGGVSVEKWKDGGGRDRELYSVYVPDQTRCVADVASLSEALQIYAARVAPAAPLGEESR